MADPPHRSLVLRRADISWETGGVADGKGMQTAEVGYVVNGTYGYCISQRAGMGEPVREVTPALLVTRRLRPLFEPRLALCLDPYTSCVSPGAS